MKPFDEFNDTIRHPDQWGDSSTSDGNYITFGCRFHDGMTIVYDPDGERWQLESEYSGVVASGQERERLRDILNRVGGKWESLLNDEEL